MAVLHKKRNANTKKRARLMLGMAACVFAPTALAVWHLTALLAKRQPPAALAYGALAAAAAGALCFRVLYTRSAVLKSGIDGERQAAAALRALPYAYHVLVNPVFRVRGKVMELDAVVVGKNGVFIVETKNHAGVITGKTDAEWWSQVKRRGAKTMKNPLLQAERQHKLMEQLLADAKQACPVHSFVYFAAPFRARRSRGARWTRHGWLPCWSRPANSIFCAFPYLGRPAAHFEPRGFLVEKQR